MHLKYLDFRYGVTPWMVLPGAVRRPRTSLVTPVRLENSAIFHARVAIAHIADRRTDGHTKGNG